MSNKEKTRVLGINFSTASQRLRKLILFDFMQRLDLDQCFQCGKQIEDVDDMSIEHKRPWQSADDPTAEFFNLDNIDFSHLRCNIGARRGAKNTQTECIRGHPFNEKNTYWKRGGGRACRECQRQHRARYRAKLKRSSVAQQEEAQRLDRC